MKTRLIHIIAATSASAALGLGVINIQPSQAAGFNFSYTLQDGSILAGMLEGDVQSDGDTVFVSSISMPSFNGIPGPDLPVVESLIEFNGGPAGTPTVSFSGLTMDIIACTDSTCTDGFLFDSAGAVFGFPVYSSGGAYGTLEIYNPENWELVAKAIPEPLTLLGVGTALGFGTFFKRKIGKNA